MKKVVLLILLSFLILISGFFYIKYFTKSETVKVQQNQISNQTITGNENNLIKNLNYELITEHSEFKINSELSEITYVDGEELILMDGVKAKLRDNLSKNNTSLIVISSEKGQQNNNAYYTKFTQNVKISYLENTILSDELILDLKENIILIKNNIKLDSPYGVFKADNIKINLITSKIDIFMNDDKKNIVFLSKK
jgi:hypothetical protein